MVDPPTNAFLSVSGLRCKGFSGDALPPPTNFYFVERGERPSGGGSKLHRAWVPSPSGSATDEICTGDCM